MSHDGADEPYKVGKGKPPKEHQFKKGQPSPNGGGRPKGSTRESQLRKMLKKKIWVTGPDGRRTRRPIQEVIDHRLIEIAAKGDLKAIKLVNELVIMHARYEQARQPSAEEVQQQIAEDEERRKATKWVNDTLMEYLELQEDLRRYGITQPGGGFADCVMKTAAEHNPQSYWARDYLSPEELAAALARSFNQAVEQSGG